MFGGIVIEESDSYDIFVGKSISHVSVSERISKQDDVFPVFDLFIDRQVMNYRFTFIETMDDRLSDSYRLACFVSHKRI